MVAEITFRAEKFVVREILGPLAKHGLDLLCSVGFHDGGEVLFDAYSGSPLLMWGIMAAITFVAAIGFLRWFTAYKHRFQ